MTIYWANVNPSNVGNVITYNKQILLKRGNTEVSSVYTGPLGEATLDTGLMTIRVHDGNTAGGYVLASQDWVANTITADFGMVNGNIIPAVANVYNIGSATLPFHHLFVGEGTIYIGNIKLTNDAGQLLVQQVNNPGQSNEAVVPGSTGVVTTDRLTNGSHVFSLSSSGIVELDGNPFNSGGQAITNFGNIELTNQIAQTDFYAGPLVSFTKTDYGNEIDVIDTSLSITRGNQQGIYNPELEPGWDDTGGDPDGRRSPKNTLWNADGWADVTNLDQRTYIPFYDAVGGNLGNNVLGPLFIMKDTVNNKYYKIDFTVWGNANSGAPVTYTRQQVDGVTGDAIGDPVTFIKPGYVDPFVYYDNIDTGLQISRGSNQGIFNVALETGWNNNYYGDGSGYTSPAGTLWNIDGWDDLSDVKTRTYKSLLDAFNWGLGEKIIGTKCVMKDTINNKYYAIKFTKWTQGGNGGGFSYTRQLINPDVAFVHSTNGNEVDIIIEDDPQGSGVAITRDEYGAIYNPYRENSWDDTVSPGGTLWNWDGWDDLSDVTSRNYTTFYQVFGSGGIGEKIEGAELIMKVVDTNTYYKVKFTYWQKGGGGAFRYIKTLIDTSGNLHEGIKFADGTIQKTAATNAVKYRASGKRSIQEWYGNKTVTLTQATPFTLDTTVWQNYNNSGYMYVIMPNLEYRDQFINNVLRNISVSLDNGSTWIPVISGGGGYNGSNHYVYFYEPNYNGVFTINNGSAIKVRYYRGGEPAMWFDPTESPAGISSLRGAIVDYHAYSDRSGTIVGQIIISRGDNNFNVTHTESTSASGQVASLDLWKIETSGSAQEGQLYAWRSDGDNDIVKLQWKATLFYGSEY